MNDRKHDPSSIRQNKYIRQQDKSHQTMIEENKNIQNQLTHDENFRVRTFLEGLSVCLYASAYLALPRTSATVINTDSEIDITSTNSSATTSSVDKLSFGASKKAMTLYGSGGFENDKKALTEIIQQVKKNKDTECRIKAVTKNPDFKITFIHESEAFMKDVRAEYNVERNEASFIMNTKVDEKNKRFFLHEVSGHAFVASQNKVENINMKGIPYQTPEEKKQFQHSIDIALERIKQDLSLFDKKIVLLTKEEKMRVDQMNKLASDYKATHIQTISVSKSELGKAIKNKDRLNQDIIMLSPLKIRGGEIPLYHHGYKKITDEKYEGIVTVDDGVSARGKVALLDMYWLLTVHVPENNYPLKQIHDAEKDAYAQELIQLYPKIFDPIFAELKEYHFNRGDEEYKNCMNPKIR